MADKCLLFTYGLLMPAPNGQRRRSSPKSVSAWWEDRVHGELYDLKTFPAAVKVGLSQSWITGVVVEIDAAELPDLDDFEDVDSGEFRRSTVTTDKGHLCWIYEYAHAIPADAARITGWLNFQS